MATVKKRRKLSTKITLMFLVLLVIMMAAIGYVAYQTSYNSVLNDYNSIGESAGILAADIIDTDITVPNIFIIQSCRSLCTDLKTLFMIPKHRLKVNSNSASRPPFFST